MKLFAHLVIVLSLLLTCNMAAFCADSVTAGEVTRQTQMPKNFTIRYSVVEQDVRPPDMRQFLYSYLEKIAVDKAKADEGKTQTKKINRPNYSGIKDTYPTHAYVLTLSQRQGKIFLMRDSPQERTVTVYDGKSSFVYTKRKNEQYGDAQILPGLSAISTTLLPLPSAGVDALPLIKNARPGPALTSSEYVISGMSPMFNRGSAPEMPYLPSETRMTLSSGAMQLQNCVLKDKDGATNQRWDYRTYVRFHSIQVAQNMTFTDYQSYSVGMRYLRKPMTVFTYKLIDLKDEAVPLTYFDYSTWLANQDSVQTASGGQPVGFQFRKGAGGIEQQARRGLWEQQKNTAQIENGDFLAGRTGGVFVLISVVGLIVAWLWRVKRGTARKSSHD